MWKKALQHLKWFKEHVPYARFRQYPNFRTIIPIVSAFWSQFPTCHHCPSSTVPARWVWRPTNNEEADDVNEARGLYEHFFFVSIDRAKIYSPLLMNVGGQDFFSPSKFLSKKFMRIPIWTNNFKLSFFSDIRWFFWKWLIVTKQTNSSAQNTLESIDTNLVLLDTTLPQTELVLQVFWPCSLHPIVSQVARGWLH